MEISTTYEKISDIEFKKTQVVTETRVTICDIETLLQQKANIADQIERQKGELKKAIKEAEKELFAINSLFAKLKLKEVVKAHDITGMIRQLEQQPI